MARQHPVPDLSSAYDVILIGAGINGAGIAHEAARRGLRVLVLEKGDVASGTTSWSTRLIHGGLRYLEYAEVGLVRESLREREVLLRIAPHLVRPLPLLIPIYKGARRGRLLMRAGMLAYDALSWDKSLPHHHMLSAAATLERAQGLRPQGLLGSALYYDAQVTFPERLALENVLAAEALGAQVVTYAQVTNLVQEAGHVTGVVFQDLRTGQRHTARAGTVVNVAGPWVDTVVAAQTPPAALVAGTKGTHLVVQPFAGAPAVGLYAEAQADGRPFFILPWNGLCLVGTTDTRYTGSLDQVEATPEEVAYLLAETNHLFPEANLSTHHVLYTYAGVRPLPAVPAGAEAGITRRHFVHQHTGSLRGLLSIVGGKLTTYRSLAEEVTDLLCARAGVECAASSTARTPLPGALPVADVPAFQQQLMQEYPFVPVTTLQRLVALYGQRTAQVLQLAAATPALRQPLAPASPSLAAEIVFAVQQEQAETLTDCLLRRTMLGLNAAAGLDVLATTGMVAQQYLGWSEERTAAEAAAYRAYIRRFHPRQQG